MILDGRLDVPVSTQAVESLLAGRVRPQLMIGIADGAELAAYRRLRRDVFVAEQGLFSSDDRDDIDDDPRCVVLVARDVRGQVVGGVRLAPVTGVDLGWWQGGRLVVAPGSRASAGVARGIGAALVRAACAVAESHGVLRFEADIQRSNETFFARLGWIAVRPISVAGSPHIRMRWPIDRISRLASDTKRALGGLLDGLVEVAPGFLGDDGAPVPGSDLVAACDAIVPSLVERDPEWAGWCGVLVNVNDLAAMGAVPVGLLDAVAARNAEAAARVLSGIRAASAAYGIPVLGGHTQLGVPAALSITALGRTDHPVPGSGGRPGHDVTLTVDLGGGWRHGYTGQQWDSTTSRTGDELRAMTRALGASPPAAAKDVSMAGIVGTLGMLAEASGCSAELDVAAVPRPPSGATMGDWLTCFPGFGLLTTDTPGIARPPAGPATSAPCGRLGAGEGVTLRWPDGECTSALTGGVTGMGSAV
jgi:putative N-acetyltransferase (TIGR04045 family)